MIRYQNYEVYAQSPDGLVHVHTVRATSSEHAERIVRAGLRKGWKVIGTAHQFKLEDDKKWRKQS